MRINEEIGAREILSPEYAGYLETTDLNFRNVFPVRSSRVYVDKRSCIHAFPKNILLNNLKYSSKIIFSLVKSLYEASSFFGYLLRVTVRALVYHIQN